MTPMTSQEIELKVRELLSARSGVALDKISAETRIAEDLGVDSFGSVELMFEIEEAFGLEIPDGDIMHVRSVKDITAYLEAWFSRTSGPRAQA